MKRYVSFFWLVTLLLGCRADEAQPLLLLPLNAPASQTGVVLFSRTVAKRQFWDYSDNTFLQIAGG
jgi:hypothetical protein